MKRLALSHSACECGIARIPRAWRENRSIEITIPRGREKEKCAKEKHFKSEAYELFLALSWPVSCRSTWRILVEVKIDNNDQHWTVSVLKQCSRGKNSTWSLLVSEGNLLRWVCFLGNEDGRMGIFVYVADTLWKSYGNSCIHTEICCSLWKLRSQVRFV